jgi:hypothetical protein
MVKIRSGLYFLYNFEFVYILRTLKGMQRLLWKF